MEDHTQIEKLIQCFRVRELGYCLEVFGLRRSGKKAEMHSRLLDYYRQHRDGQGRESSAGKVVTEVYNRMISGLPMISGHGTATISGRVEEDAIRGNNAARQYSFRDASSSAPVHHHGQVRCLCGHQTWREGRMIQCRGENCKVWQHLDCVTLSGSTIPTEFYCELCRSERADPFWENIGVAVLPFTKLRQNGRHVMQAGSALQHVQFQERMFMLNPPFLQKVVRKELRLQVVCLMMSDPIPFRFHWPRTCNLRINNTQYRVYGRSQPNKLGNNQRDEPAIIDMLLRKDGKNSLSIDCADNRLFAVSVQIVEKKSHEDVKKKMKPIEHLDHAVLRVIGQVKGGGVDEGVETTSAVISLKCPLSGMRIVTPARFADVDMLEAVFDLDSFLLSAEKSRKWACPNSLRPSCVQNLQVDIYVERILKCLCAAPSILEVEVNTEGGWRPNGTDGPWRSIFDESPITCVKAQEDSDAMSEDSSEDEYEELRRAAAAMKELNEKSRRGHKEEKPVPVAVDVIDLISDDEVEDKEPPRNVRNFRQTPVNSIRQALQQKATRVHPQGVASASEVRPPISYAASGFPRVSFTVGPSGPNYSSQINPSIPLPQYLPPASFPPNVSQVRNTAADKMPLNPPSTPAPSPIPSLSGWGQRNRGPNLMFLRNVPIMGPVPRPSGLDQHMGAGGMPSGIGQSQATFNVPHRSFSQFGFHDPSPGGVVGSHMGQKRKLTPNYEQDCMSQRVVRRANGLHEVTLRASDILCCTTGPQSPKQVEKNIEVINLDSEDD